MTILENGPFRLATITKIDTNSTKTKTTKMPVSYGVSVEYNCGYYGGDSNNYLVILMIKWQDGKVVKEDVDNRDLAYVDKNNYNLYKLFCECAIKLVQAANYHA